MANTWLNVSAQLGALIGGLGTLALAGIAIFTVPDIYQNLQLQSQLRILEGRYHNLQMQIDAASTELTRKENDLNDTQRALKTAAESLSATRAENLKLQDQNLALVNAISARSKEQDRLLHTVADATRQVTNLTEERARLEIERTSLETVLQQASRRAYDYVISIVISKSKSKIRTKSMSFQIELRKLRAKKRFQQIEETLKNDIDLSKDTLSERLQDLPKASDFESSSLDSGLSGVRLKVLDAIESFYWMKQPSDKISEPFLFDLYVNDYGTARDIVQAALEGEEFEVLGSEQYKTLREYVGLIIDKHPGVFDASLSLTDTEKAELEYLESTDQKIEYYEKMIVEKNNLVEKIFKEIDAMENELKSRLY